MISATPFNKLLDGDANLTGIVYGKETFGEVLTLNEPQKAKITFAADQKVYQVGRSENEKDEDGNVTEKIVMYDTYAASSVKSRYGSVRNLGAGRRRSKNRNV